MNAGDLRDRIQLEQILGAGDGAWMPFDTLWAAVDPLGTDGAYRVRIRYREDLKDKRDIRRGLRVLFRGRVMDVLDVTEVERRQEVHLDCRDVIADVPVLATGAKGVKGWSG